MKAELLLTSHLEYHSIPAVSLLSMVWLFSPSSVLLLQPVKCCCVNAAKAERTVWLAANVSTDDVSASLLELHGALRARFSNLLTVIAPKDVAQAPQAAAEFTAQGLKVTLWSDISQVSLHLLSRVPCLYSLALVHHLLLM